MLEDRLKGVDRVDTVVDQGRGFPRDHIDLETSVEHGDGCSGPLESNFLGFTITNP